MLVARASQRQGKKGRRPPHPALRFFTLTRVGELYKMPRLFKA
jgi:hypothetical protein